MGHLFGSQNMMGLIQQYIQTQHNQRLLEPRQGLIKTCRQWTHCHFLLGRCDTCVKETWNRPTDVKELWRVPRSRGKLEVPSPVHRNRITAWGLPAVPGLLLCCSNQRELDCSRTKHLVPGDCLKSEAAITPTLSPQNLQLEPKVRNPRPEYMQEILAAAQSNEKLTRSCLK